MSRYIDEISARENFQDVLAYMGSEVKRMLKKIPTADVVEVVRCKDCAYYRYVDGADIYKCDRRGFYSEEVKPTDYCSYGERSENGT